MQPFDSILLLLHDQMSGQFNGKAGEWSRFLSQDEA